MSTTPDHRTEQPVWTPGAGLERLRREWGDDRIPEITPEVEAKVEGWIAEARRLGASKAA